MKIRIVVGISLLLTACSIVLPGGEVSVGDDPPEEVSSPEKGVEVELENYGPAPELENEIWLNTDEPLRLANLRGQVVLLEMWTFG